MLYDCLEMLHVSADTLCVKNILLYLVYLYIDMYEYLTKILLFHKSKLAYAKLEAQQNYCECPNSGKYSVFLTEATTKIHFSADILWCLLAINHRAADRV